MPLRGLRPNRSERDLNRRSTLDPAGLFKRGEKASSANKSSERLAPDRLAVSVDGGRPPSTDLPSPAWPAGHDDPPPSPPVQESTPNTKRFSMLRFRHASDSQLSTKAKEQAAADAPPVPAMPAAPAIITTAPTVVDHDQDQTQGQGQEPPQLRKKGVLGQLNLRRRSFDPGSVSRPNLRKSMDKKGSSDMKRKPFGLKKSDIVEEPGRLSTTQRPGVAAGLVSEANSAQSLPVPRMSESSRSDASSGGHISFENTPKPRAIPRTKSSRFGFSGRSKRQTSLFPLPMKISPPEFPDTAPATPRASTSGISSGSPNQSPSAESPPLTALHHAQMRHDLENGTRTPPIPSPSQVALAASQMNFTTPKGDSGLLRNDSQKSIHSSRSSPNAAAPMRLGLRGRSSTMGSLGGRSDDAPPPTPPYATSGRNSTSTVGRSSLSNLFGLGARFRQNSEPYSPRHGSPAHGQAGTPGLSSHQNSLNISREVLVMPEREEGETPGHYLERLEEVMDRGVIASVLTKTDDAFHLAVLRSYMRKFAFFGDPIDMAIRKMLMQVELPKETQQIDRVLQGFADRYHECNPGIYINPDKAYFISFSIVILHTDVFNKNNKRKMQRPDYIKNSSCEGVSEDVLGCIYDNIAYTPFIHFEDDLDIKGIAGRKTKKTSVFKAPMNDPARKATREPIDPYTLIFEGKLDALRPNIKDVMNLDDPYNYLGSAGSLDIRSLYHSFSRYGVLQIVSSRSRPEAFMSQVSQGDMPDAPIETSFGVVEMPVTKVGILWRKDTKRKAARSPWQEWGAILTRSGLSLFRNSAWVKSLIHQHDHHLKHGNSGPVVFQPKLTEFKQDHIIPLDGLVALVDNTYKKHKNAFIIFSTKTGEETFLADSEKDWNDWLGMLNYSAAFETLGVRPRGLIGGLYEGQRNRGIRRLESSQSTKSVSTPTGEVTIRSGKIDNQFAQQMMTARRELMAVRIRESEERLTESIRDLENKLRDARHLQILAPVQPKTRELVIHAAGRLSAKLKWTRIWIWRMKCHRDILAKELQDEESSQNERQARIDRIAEGSQPSPSEKSSEKPSRASRIGSLARLSSKTSSMTAGQKPPHSPSTSMRPDTKSSKETTDFDRDDVFKTPPETSRQSSPNQVSSGQLDFPPLSFSPNSSNHRSSLASSNPQSPRLIPRDHRPSVSTVDGRPISSDGASDAGARYSTPPPPEDNEGQKMETKSSEPPGSGKLRLDADSESETDQTPAALTGSPESKSKVRRSLHRTLRDSQSGPSHRRSHKGRDSASTIVSDDTLESEGLSRAKGSFTVHGKKASVITFGSEWQNMPAEERLKVRKHAQSIAEPNVIEDDQARSIASESTGTVLAAPTQNDHEDDTTPRQSRDAKKQRHVSTATITPYNSAKAANGNTSESSEDDSSESSEDEEEEVSSKKQESAKRATDESGAADRNRLNVPRPQAVEA